MQLRLALSRLASYWFSSGMSFTAGGGGMLARYAWISVSSALLTTLSVNGGMLPDGCLT